MYSNRIKVFIAIVSAILVICVGRLAFMQLAENSHYRKQIEELRRMEGSYRSLRTMRGRILDRHGRVLAVDRPRFELCVSYELISMFDERVKRAILTKAERRTDKPKLLQQKRDEIVARFEDADRIVDKCVIFGVDRDELLEDIMKINDRIWRIREHLAWKRKCPDVPFEQGVPDPDERLLLAGQVDIVEMHDLYPIFSLEGQYEVFTAMLEFQDTRGVEIATEGNRQYPYGSVAAQTIGWVGPEQKGELFAEDPLMRYEGNEVSGRRPGAEFVCEALLRGRRGEEKYDIDHQLVEQQKTQFGEDVTLTVDIELQRRIENMLRVYEHQPHCTEKMAAVVIDVVTGDILAMVSLPTFDLNEIRTEFGESITDKHMLNRAIKQWYPPGSVVKPIILVAGFEEKAITSEEAIPCHAEPAPDMWPSCWIYRKVGIGHSDLWLNKGRNAIRGSCNVYFSRLADRMGPRRLQYWLWRFGYGRQLLQPPDELKGTEYERTFLELRGEISSSSERIYVSDFNDVPQLKRSHRRWFGMGQGNFRVTPLQVANAMAILARGGLYKNPRIFLENENPTITLDIEPFSIHVVADGMHAVTSELHGTAYTAFKGAGFDPEGIRIYGKTGSTEGIETAWFGGWAEDEKSHAVALAIVVEGGQSGQQDAAPLAREIFNLCIESGYIGQAIYDPETYEP